MVLAEQHLGCAVNPTPLQPNLSPQPLVCLLSIAIQRPTLACGQARVVLGPPTLPTTQTLTMGLQRQATFTLQAVIQDNGAANRRGVSMSNAVVLRIE